MKKVLGVLLALIVVLVAFVASRPATFHIERSATIAAPADSVFAHIGDLHQWPSWSPWEKLDPNMTRSFAGTGVGSTYQWAGNDKVGEGRMTVTELEPARSVVLKLDFIKPFQATSTARFALDPAPEGTRVTWSMDGNNNFIAKAMCIVMPMDKMVGPDFERGLAGLKAVAEASAAAAPAADSTAAATH